jgi:hypothetical protein
MWPQRSSSAAIRVSGFAMTWALRVHSRDRPLVPKSRDTLSLAARADPVKNRLLRAAFANVAPIAQSCSLIRGG